MPHSTEELAHLEWLGYVQPVGLVVSIPALLQAQCHVQRHISPQHARFLELLPRDAAGNLIPEIRDLPRFTREILEWETDDLREVPARGDLPAELAGLEVILPQYHETLRPTRAVPVFRPAEGQNPWLMLVQELPSGTPFDEPAEAANSRHWQATPQLKFERLLRETEVPIGLLSNARQLRLVYAPRGESSGHATFDVAEMAQVAGRPIFAALHMLLNSQQLFSVAPEQRLSAILAASRKYQNTVSTKLAEQVLAALYELMRGFQGASDDTRGDLLREILAHNPNHVYAGLLTVLMRLVFVLFSEDRDLMSGESVYSNHYSVTGLFDRLRTDAGQHPDTMDHRYGAWAQLLTLFRLVYEGGSHGEFQLPARKGYLFDPDRYPFLEGRVAGIGNGGSGIGNGGSGIGNGGGKGNSDGSAIVSGSSRLAVGNGPDGGLLPGDEDVSAGRTVRSDESDSAIGQFNSGKHRGGTRAGNEGVLSVSQNRSGQSDGTGNAPHDRPAGGDSAAEQAPVAPADDRSAGADAHQAPAESSQLTPNPEPPIPSPSVPRISDGVVYRVLRNLLILDGERLSYRTLDVEQIGSVYETMMGFNLETATGRSIAIRPVKRHGAPATINLEELLATPDKHRAKWITEQTDHKITGTALKALKAATTLDELLDALGKKIDRNVTPRMVPAGAIVLQPSDERRRSGSHYTPRSLTEPIVRTTLEPILKNLVEQSGVGDEASGLEDGKPRKKTRSLIVRRNLTRGDKARLQQQEQRRAETTAAARRLGTPHPAQILDLKICDPAMGSGAFLVEACRQLGDHLVAAWHAHDCLPTDIPPDEDEILYARRLVAQRCLYGVDKNPVAVDLAKLSLWLVTLAKSHAFTFLDHALRHGDSLVGLTRQQIIGFHWEPKQQKDIEGSIIEARLERATSERHLILDAREDTPYRDQQQRLALAEEALSVVRLIGDACVSAFFAGRKKKDRQQRVDDLFASLSEWFASGMHPDLRGPIAEAAAALRSGEHPVPPFHWEIEFPEVFGRENPGFDAFVGNPPFAGKNTLINSSRTSYPDWLKSTHEESHGNADLVSHFFRSVFTLLRSEGCFGLIATNTIAQGDTRSTGLRWIRLHGGRIYHVRRRYRWPGQAAVVVSVIHVSNGDSFVRCLLDGRPVDDITAFLFHTGGDEDPQLLQQNADISFVGSYPLGMGFTFDDSTSNLDASPLAVMRDLIASNSRNAERIFPYIGGEEINDSPGHEHHRFIIDFFDRTLEQASEWSDLVQIVRERVKPLRDRQKRKAVRERWWQYAEKRPGLYAAIKGRPRVLVCGQTSKYRNFVFLDNDLVYDQKVIVFATDSMGRFATMQSQVHLMWSSFMGSTMKDDPVYTPSDCFETFPFPKDVEQNQCLADSGEALYEYREGLLVQTDLGLTSTYNRFHDPHEQSEGILELRRLHGLMDGAVLRAYGWDDLAEQATCEFLLDYEDEDEGLGESPAPKSKSRKKKPWRYRWPDEFRDEVLARLLELNEQRALEERLAGETAEAAKPKTRRRRAPAKKKPGRGDGEPGGLFGEETT